MKIEIAAISIFGVMVIWYVFQIYRSEAIGPRWLHWSCFLYLFAFPLVVLHPGALVASVVMLAPVAAVTDAATTED